MSTNEYARYLLMANVMNGLSEEDRRMFVRYILENNNENVMRKIDERSEQLSELIKKETSFGKDFLSNVLGNYAADASIYILTRLFKR